MAWVTLDLRDNDPVELVSCIAAAFAPTQGLPSSFWESMSSPGGSVLGRLGPRLAAAFAEADQPYRRPRRPPRGDVAVVPRCDRLAGEEHAGWIRLRGSGPKGASRPRKLRVREPVLELGAEDLAFDPDESAHFFRIGGLPCQRSRPERCTTRSKVGWRDCNWP